MEKTDRLRSDMFGELLQAANTIGDLRNCPVFQLFFHFNLLHVHQILTYLSVLSYFSKIENSNNVAYYHVTCRLLVRSDNFKA